jgi:hypothetical protein
MYASLCIFFILFMHYSKYEERRREIYRCVNAKHVAGAFRINFAPIQQHRFDLLKAGKALIAWPFFQERILMLSIARQSEHGHRSVWRAMFKQRRETMEPFANLTSEGVELVQRTEQTLRELAGEPVVLIAYRAEREKGT